MRVRRYEVRDARMRNFKMHKECPLSHCTYPPWIPNSLSCRVLLALALFCTAGIGASPLSFAAEESDQPTGKSVATSPQKEPEPTQRPLERLIMGATPEEHARLEAERERLSAAAAKFGTDPTAVIGFNQLTYNHLSLTNGVRVDSAVATVRVPLTPNYFVQVAMPYAWADSNQSNAFPLRGAGDMIMRMGGRIYSSENIALFVGADVSFPTASERQLGTGKYMIGPGGGVAVPLAKLNSLFLLIATENHSIGGDPSRNDVHFTRIQPAINTIWSKRVWTLVAMAWDINWNNSGKWSNGGKQSLNMLAEVGYQFVDQWSVFAGPGVGLAGRDTPTGVDWGVQAGIRWVYVTPLFSRTIFDLPLGK